MKTTQLNAEQIKAIRELSLKEMAQERDIPVEQMRGLINMDRLGDLRKKFARAISRKIASTSFSKL